MNYLVEIASVLNANEIKCFRCDGIKWEAKPPKEAVCISCRDSNREKYGIARLESNSVHIYVHHAGSEEYGEDNFPFAIDERGFTPQLVLLPSKQNKFIQSLETTLNSNEIPCPCCKRKDVWRTTWNYHNDVYYATCRLCKSKDGGCARC